MATIFKQSAMFLCLISLIFQGCATRCPVADLDDDYFEAAQALDCVAQSVEEFGTVSISAPYIIRPSEKFSFDLNKDADYFFDHRGVQGSVMLSQQKAVDLQVSLSVQLEELSAALQALKTAQGASNVADKLAKVKKTLGSIDIIEDMFTAEGLAATLAATQGDYAPLIALAQQVVEKADEAEEEAEEDTDGDAEDADADDDDPEESPVTSGGQLFDREMRTALNTLSSKTFTPPLAGYQGDIDLSPGEKLTLAASDKNRMDVLRWLAHPDEAELGDNKIAYLCMLNVSCYPGWRTRKGYAAEVMVNVGYKKKGKTPLKNIALMNIEDELVETLELIQQPRFNEEKTQQIVQEITSHIRQKDIYNNNSETIEELSEQAICTKLDQMQSSIQKEVVNFLTDEKISELAGSPYIKQGPGGPNEQLINALKALKATQDDSNKLYRAMDYIGIPATHNKLESKGGSYTELSYATSSDGLTGSVRPLVAGVYPMLDAQVLDVQTSFRSQKSFAMKLMAMGYGIVGESFLDAVERIEKDSKTRETVTMGSAFSRNGTTFGVRVEPRFVSLKDLSGKESKSGYQMKSTTFPAMVLLVCDRSDIQEQYNGTAEIGGFSEIQFDITTRWVPIGKKGKDKKRLNELHYLSRANQIDTVREKLKTLIESPKKSSTILSGELYRRYNAIIDESGAGKDYLPGITRNQACKIRRKRLCGALQWLDGRCLPVFDST